MNEKTSTSKKKDKKKTNKISPKMKEEIASDLIKQIPVIEDKNNDKKGPGRPAKISPQVLHKLKTCFAVGMTDAQACYFCQISETTLYKYQDENPEFTEEKSILKQSITMQAKFNVGKSIKEGNVIDSWQRLKLRDPDFKDKLQVDGNIKTEMSPEEQDMYQKILKQNGMIGNQEIKN